MAFQELSSRSMSGGGGGLSLVKKAQNMLNQAAANQQRGGATAAIFDHADVELTGLSVGELSELIHLQQKQGLEASNPLPAYTPLNPHRLSSSSTISNPTEMGRLVVRQTALMERLKQFRSTDPSASQVR